MQPVASTISISATEAVSKQEPSEAKQRQHLRRRVGLHGVEHAGVRQRLREGRVVVAHDIEVDDQARSVVQAGIAAVAQEVADARGHWRSPHHRLKGRRTARLKVQARATRPASAGEEASRGRAMETRRTQRALRPRCCLGLERENPSARPARMDKPLRCRPLEGRRDHRSPLRRCFKPRPPLSAGCAGFASGCQSRC